MAENTVNQAQRPSLAEMHATYFVMAKGRLPVSTDEFVLWLRDYDRELWNLMEGLEKTLSEYVSNVCRPCVVNFGEVEIQQKNAALREAIPFMSHLGTCPYGDDSPDGDFCTCRVQSVVRKMRETLT